MVVVNWTDEGKVIKRARGCSSPALLSNFSLKSTRITKKHEWVSLRRDKLKPGETLPPSENMSSGYGQQSWQAVKNSIRG